MTWEKSCGAVLYTQENGETRYVLTRNYKGFYGFPKGHVEAGESELETAQREIYEEVGIRPVFVEGFRETVEYPLVDKENTWKQVVLFLAEYSGQAIVAQPEELSCAEVLPFGEALERLQRDSLREVLRRADALIKQR